MDSSKPKIIADLPQELGLIDAFGNSLEKKPTLSIDDDQAKWKADKLAKEAANKQAMHTTGCILYRLSKKNRCFKFQKLKQANLYSDIPAACSGSMLGQAASICFCDSVVASALASLVFFLNHMDGSGE